MHSRGKSVSLPLEATREHSVWREHVIATSVRPYHGVMRGLVGAPLLLSFLLTSCEEKQVNALMLAIQTNYAAPKDVDEVGLYITSDGRPIFSDTRQVAPDGTVRFPATIAVVGDEAKVRAVIRVRAVGFQKQKARVLRDVVTTIPKARTALLRVPLEWLNEGSGEGSSAAVTDGFRDLVSICPAGTTSIGGECRDATVDSERLPDYAETEVFGGGNAEGAGLCFDVNECFRDAVRVAVDPTSCKVEGQIIGANTNVALAVRAAGECGRDQSQVCDEGLVALDQGGESGWSVQGSALALPLGVCRKMQEGKVSGVLLSSRCASKTDKYPICGKASGVQGGSLGPAPEETPAPIAQDASVSPKDAGVDATVIADAGKDATTITDSGFRDAQADGSFDASTGADASFDAGVDATANPVAISTDFDPPESVLMGGEPWPISIAATPTDVYFGRRGTLNDTSPRWGIVRAAATGSDAAPMLEPWELTRPRQPTAGFQVKTRLSTNWGAAIQNRLGTSDPGYLMLFKLNDFSPPSRYEKAIGGHESTIAISDNGFYFEGELTGQTTMRYLAFTDVSSSVWSIESVQPSNDPITALEWDADWLYVGLQNGQVRRCTATGLPNQVCGVVTGHETIVTSSFQCAVTNMAIYRELPIGPTRLYWYALPTVAGNPSCQGIWTTIVSADAAVMVGSVIRIADAPDFDDPGYGQQGVVDPPARRTFAVDQRYIYFGSNADTLLITRRDGSEPGVRYRFDTDPSFVSGVSATDTHVYWTTFGANGNVRRARKRF